MPVFEELGGKLESMKKKSNQRVGIRTNNKLKRSANVGMSWQSVMKAGNYNADSKLLRVKTEKRHDCAEFL